MILVFLPVRAEVKPISSGSHRDGQGLLLIEGVVSCNRGRDEGTEGVPGEHSCVGGHGIVGEQGGVAWRDGGRYGKVGGIDGGGVGGN